MIPWLSGLHYQPGVLMVSAAGAFEACSVEEEKEIYDGLVSNGVGGFQKHDRGLTTAELRPRLLCYL